MELALLMVLPCSQPSWVTLAWKSELEDVPVETPLKGLVTDNVIGVRWPVLV